MPAYKIFMLGAFRVEADGKPIPAKAWRSKQSRQIFKFLLSRWGRAVSSNELIEILWPEENPASVQDQLYVRISQLRHLLDARNPSAFIHKVEGGYLFNSQADIWTDVREFEALCQR